MTEYHSIAWTISPEHVQGNFQCHAPHGAVCRLACAEECGAESYPCCSYDGPEGSEREHKLIDGGLCNPLEFMAECSPEEAYNGPNNVPLHDGPVVMEWDPRSTFYQWHYVDYPPVRSEASDA